MMAGSRSLTRVEEGIYRNSAGNLVVRVYDPFKKDTRQKTLAEGTSLRQARRDRVEFEKEVRKTGAGDEETCESFARRWPKDYKDRRGESTLQYNEERSRAFIRDFNGTRLREVTPVIARAWIEGGVVPPQVEKFAKRWKGAVQTDEGLSVPPHRSHLLAIRAMFTDAMKSGLVDVNPFAQMNLRQSRGRKDITVLTQAELDRLIQIAQQSHGPGWGQMYAAMIQIAAYTGLRPGELYALEWSDIDFKAKRIHVREQMHTKLGKRTQTKNKLERTIGLLPQAERAFKRIEQRPDGDPTIFYTKRGEHFTGRVAHYYWNPVRTAFWASLPPDRQKKIERDFDFYELRHFFGSLLARAGATPYDIAKQMGHQDGGKLAMARYIHTDEEESADRVLELLRRAS